MAVRCEPLGYRKLKLCLAFKIQKFLNGTFPKSFLPHQSSKVVIQQCASYNLRRGSATTVDQNDSRDTAESIVPLSFENVLGPIPESLDHDFIAAFHPVARDINGGFQKTSSVVSHVQNNAADILNQYLRKGL